ncbi:PREDICTED: putative gustatory receptor 28b [Polistes canadensis]|uniref:putative gustatory receptor 28b n=1 Tax=Polistes canadensis TaxID=91411 RepID=UPI000718FE97|nr:PREDICTED: putative gustatory receptor 28b [Polistes canadensis]
MPRNHSRRILSLIYSISLLAFNYGIWRYLSQNSKHSGVFKFDETVDYLIYYTNFIVLFTIAMKGLQQTESLKLCVKKMHEIDKTLETLGSSLSFNKIYKKTMMELLLFLSFVTFLFVITGIQLVSLYTTYILLLPVVYLNIIHYGYTFMVEFLLVFEFCTMVRCIKSEFQRANDLLSDVNILPMTSIASELIERSFLVDSNKLFDLSSSFHKMHSRLQVASHKLNRSKKLLRTIRQVHLELYRISKSFGNMYGIQMSLEIAVCIICNTHLLYHLYDIFLNQKLSNSGKNFALFTTITACLQYTIRIFAVNYICDRTTDEAERTNEIIHTFYGKNTDPAIRKEVEIFSIQLMQCHTSYSAFGLYNFGCKHICSCIGVIATYVVIMVQVGNSLK